MTLSDSAPTSHAGMGCEGSWDEADATPAGARGW